MIVEAAMLVPLLIGIGAILEMCRMAPWINYDGKNGPELK